MKKVLRNEKGFTLVEMMVVLLVITVLLLIAIPNVTTHSSSINKKGCDGLVHMVQSQVEAYRMEKNSMPAMEQLKADGYIHAEDMKCSDGTPITIDESGTVKGPKTGS